MPTLVQQPDLLSPQVSQLQAVARPAKESTLSTFMQTILPQVQEAAAAYDKQTADYNLALGANDALNNTSREVGLLDRIRYNQGQEYQKVSSTSAANQAETLARIKQMTTDGVSTADDIDAVLKAHSTREVNVINDSDLDPTLKTALYQTQLKDHALVQQSATKLIQAANADKAFHASTTASALFTEALNNPNSTPTDVLGSASTYLSRLREGAVAAKPDASAEDITKSVSDNVTGSFAFLATHFNAQDPNAIATVNNMQQVVDNLQSVVPNDTLSKLQGHVATARKQVTDLNSVFVKTTVANAIAEVDAGKQYDPAVFQQMVADNNAKVQLGALTPQDNLEAAKEIYTAQRRFNEATLGGSGKDAKFMAIAQGATRTEMMINYGMVDGDYNSNLERVVLTQHPESRAKAGLVLLGLGVTDQEGTINRPLITRGATMAVSGFSPLIAMPKDAAEKSPYYNNAVEDYNTMGQMYRSLVQTNAPLAEDFLAGIPADQQPVYKMMFESNATFDQALVGLRNPTTTTQHFKNLTQAIDGLDFKKGGNLQVKGVKGTLLTNEFGASLFRGTQEGLLPILESNIKEVAGASTSALAPLATSNDATLNLANMTALGMVVPVADGYTSTYRPARTVSMYRSVPYKSGTLGDDQYGAAMASIRDDIAKATKVSKSNVFLHMSADGSLIAQAVTDDGQQPQDKSRDWAGGVVYSQAEVVKRMQQAYDASEARGQANIKVLPTMGIPAQSAKATYGKGQAISAPAKAAFDFGGFSKQNTPKGGGSSFMAPTATGNDFFAPAPTYSILRTGTLGNTYVKVGTQTQVLKTPAMLAGVVNGNPQLADAIQQHLNDYEGFVTTVTPVKSKLTGKVVNTVANGINLDAHPDWKARALATGGDPQKLLILQADFARKDMKEQQVYAGKVGIPVASTAPYPPQFFPSQLLLTDMKWHTGNYDGITKIMNAPTLAQAKQLLRASPAWADSSAARNNKRLELLSQHFAAVGRS